MYVNNVAKKYIQTNKSPHPRARKYWHVYFYGKNGVFNAKRITWYKAFYYKLFVPFYRWHVGYCENCKSKYKFLGGKESYCPYCGKVY